MNNEEYNKCPAELTEEGNSAYQAVFSLLKERDSLDTGGCTTFYSPQEWEARGESYGRGSVLIVVHDGGSVAPFFNFDYGNYDKIDEMQDALSAVGLWAEACTNWYTAIYPVRKVER